MFKFKYSFGDRIKANQNNINYEGVIVGTDISSANTCGYYLLMCDKNIAGMRTFDDEVNNNFNGGTLEIAPSYVKKTNNIDKKVFIWIDSNLSTKSIIKPKDNKTKRSNSDKDLGRWLSGVDQYSPENYQRGNSGLEFL